MKLRFTEKLLNKIKDSVTPTNTREVATLQDKQLRDWLGLSDTTGDALSEATYITCLKILSETMGKLPLHLYQRKDGEQERINNRTQFTLSTRPNEFMTATTFWATVEINRLHYGNAYCLLKSDRKGEIEQAHILRSDRMSILIDNVGKFGVSNKIWYVYHDDNREEYVYHSDEIMHFKTSQTFDGIVGKSVWDMLHETIKGELASQAYQNKLYQSGMTSKGILEYVGDLDDDRVGRVLKQLGRFSQGTSGAGQLTPIPVGFKITPLNMKLTDAQFLELRKFSANQIAAAFGVKPNHLNNYEKSSYANSEAQNISFYVDTLQFPLKQYEEEITYKALLPSQVNDGYYFKFNEKALMRTDSEAQMSALQGQVDSGIYTRNEARRLQGMNPLEGGDELYVNGATIPLKLAGIQWQKDNRKGDKDE